MVRKEKSAMMLVLHPRLLRQCRFVRFVRMIEEVRVIVKLYRCRVGFSQSDEITDILKQLKKEMSADLTAFKKKGLDRKTNHQDLTQIETEEIFVLRKASLAKETVALKLELSAKAVDAQEKAEALPRPVRPPPW